jgi:ribosomal protein L11
VYESENSVAQVKMFVQGGMGQGTPQIEPDVAPISVMNVKRISASVDHVTALEDEVTLPIES